MQGDVEGLEKLLVGTPLCHSRGGGGTPVCKVLPYVRYIAMCRCEELVFFYEDPTRPLYNEVSQRLNGMTHQQILAVLRQSFAPLNNRQMRFFNIIRQERRQARRHLRRELELWSYWNKPSETPGGVLDISLSGEVRSCPSNPDPV